MHEGAYKFVAEQVRRLEPRRYVVELGSRTVAGDWPYSGPIRPLFESAVEYTGVDIAEGPNVDVIGNAATFRWPAADPLHPCDTVVCCETLEHTDEAAAICLNAWYLLGHGGVFIVTTAGIGRAPHSAVDGGPVRDGEFYRNVSRSDLKGWLGQVTWLPDRPGNIVPPSSQVPATMGFRFWLIDTDTPGDIYALAVK